MNGQSNYDPLPPEVVFLLSLLFFAIIGGIAVALQRFTRPGPSRWIRRNCPELWSSLNKGAQRNLPNGLLEFVSGTQSQIAEGQKWLRIVEAQIADLIDCCGEREVRDGYRRDLSSVQEEARTAELFCEINVCAAMGRLFGNIVLRPKSGKGERRSDFAVRTAGGTMHGEVKRYEDKWLEAEHPQPRSIVMAADSTKPRQSLRPQSMNLRRKLEDIPAQLKTGVVGVVFVFRKGIGENISYLRAALFGDETFWGIPDGHMCLSAPALFSRDDWRDVSACALVSARGDGSLGCVHIWANPNANVVLPESVRNTLNSLN